MSEQSEVLKERIMRLLSPFCTSIDAFSRAPGAQTVARQLAKLPRRLEPTIALPAPAVLVPEFMAKLCIVNEEADETVYWLELTRDAEYASPSSDPTATPRSHRTAGDLWPLAVDQPATDDPISQIAK